LVLFLITAPLAPAATRQSTPNASPRYVPNEIIVKFHETIADTVGKQLEFNTLPRVISDNHSYLPATIKSSG
jgi:hypothetical protein